MTTYQAGALLETLGDPTRRTIFEILGERPHAVGELAARLPVSRPAVSQHLKVLKEIGLVIDRAEGNRRIYALDRDGLATIRNYFDRLWSDALDAFKHAAEQSAKEEQ